MKAKYAFAIRTGIEMAKMGPGATLVVLSGGWTPKMDRLVHLAYCHTLLRLKELS